MSERMDDLIVRSICLIACAMLIGAAALCSIAVPCDANGDVPEGHLVCAGWLDAQDS